MRILHVFKTYYPDSYGGIERVIDEISTNSSPLFEHSLLTVGMCDEIQYQQKNRLRVIRLPKQGEILSTPWGRDGRRQFELAVSQSDLIHYHAPWPLIDYWHTSVSPSKPTVLTYHADVTRSPLLAKIYALWQARTLTNVDVVVTTSTNLLNSSFLLRRLNRPVHVIPLGLSKSTVFDGHAYAQSLNEFQLPHQPFILFVGSLRSYKGIEVVVKAASASGVPLVIAGEGPLRAAIAETLPKDAPVFFLGAVSDLQKLALIERCAALVLPSTNRSEAFGLVLLEAAMQSKPQISTNLGTATSWVNLDGQTGWVVPPNDMAALVIAMREVVNNPDLAAARGRASHNRWRQLFQGTMMVAAYDQIYGDLLK